MNIEKRKTVSFDIQRSMSKGYSLSPLTTDHRPQSYLLTLWSSPDKKVVTYSF